MTDDIQMYVDATTLEMRYFRYQDALQVSMDFIKALHSYWINEYEFSYRPPSNSDSNARFRLDASEVIMECNHRLCETIYNLMITYGYDKIRRIPIPVDHIDMWITTIFIGILSELHKHLCIDNDNPLDRKSLNQYADTMFWDKLMVYPKGNESIIPLTKLVYFIRDTLMIPLYLVMVHGIANQSKALRYTYFMINEEDIYDAIFEFVESICNFK